MRINLLSLFLIFSLWADAQINVDSLKALVSQQQDTLKVKTLNNIGKHYLNYALDSSIHYHSKARKTAEKTKIEKLCFQTYFNLGLAYDFKSNFDSSYYYFKRALNSAKKMDDKKMELNTYNSLGIVNFRIGNYVSALDYYLKSLQGAENIKDTTMIVKVNNNIGHVYFYDKDFEKALKYYNVAYEIGRNTHNKNILSGAEQNRALIFMEQGKYIEAIGSLKYAKSIEEESNNIYGLANIYQHLSLCFKNLENYEKAIEMHNLSLELFEKMGNMEGIAQVYVNLGEMYEQMGKLDLALENYKKGETLCKEINSKEGLKYAYQGIHTIYAQKKDFKNAYLIHEELLIVRDSLLNEKVSGQLKELESRYESEKKDKEISILDKDREISEAKIEQLKTQTFAFGSVFILVVLLSVFIYRSYKQKQTANKILTVQKSEIQHKNNEIMASITYAKRIQEAILPNDKIVRNFFKDSFIIYKTKDIVSGTFYWMEQTNDKILFAVIDCTSDGVPGAFMSILTNNGLNKAVREDKTESPSEILAALNNHLLLHFKKDKNLKDNINIALCALNMKEKTLEYAGSNIPLIYVLNAQLNVIEGNTTALGNDFNTLFINQKINLSNGDLVYLMNGGFTAIAEKSKHQSVKNLLSEIMSEEIETQKEKINSLVSSSNLSEELCIIGLRV